MCVSSQEWDIDLPTNRQQIMTRAAERGHEVLFVDSGPFLGRHLVRLVRGGGRRSLVRRLLAAEQVAPRIRVRHARQRRAVGAASTSGRTPSTAS